MSKGGGAGKVYFVLYLAVVLELLIIIVERDEAEEHLRKQQKEAMRIVQSILAQMQSGAGTESMNTRPQDEITIPPEGINIEEIMGADIKSHREYTVEVGVTDVSSAITRRELETEKEYEQRLETLVKLASVEQIQYQLFYNPSKNPNNAPPFPTEHEISRDDINFKEFEPGQTLSAEGAESDWEFLSMIELNLDQKATYNNLNTQNIKATDIKPVYREEMKYEVGPIYAPQGKEDSVFYYAPEKSTKTMASGHTSLQKRAFVVNFKPPKQAGWYKLRFASQTNRILGVKGGMNLDDVSDETTVNIGTVQLSVGDLRKVYKELRLSLAEFELPMITTLTEDNNWDEFQTRIRDAKEMASSKDNAEEFVSKINLYGYICKLLAPGQSVNFDQNSGKMEFNVRVITPEPQIADPVLSTPEYVPTFAELPGVFEFKISPYQGTNNVIQGRVVDQTGNTAARLDLRPLDQIAGLDMELPPQGGERLYRATIDKKLSPGKYTIEMSHQLMGKESTSDIPYEVFETGLTEESEDDLKNRMNAFTFYGYPLALSVTPTSGGKVKADNFKIYLTTDAEQQKEPYQGLSISQDEAITLSPEAREVSVRVTWQQPVTGKEVDLFPENTYQIKQEPPAVSLMRMVYDVSGTAAKVKIRVDNIKLSLPPTGSDEQSEPKVNVNIAGTPEKVDGLNTYNFSIEPSIESTGENQYSIYIELSGKLERGQDKINGTISIPISAIAVNPVNGVQSEPQRKNIQIPIDHRPDRGQRRRRR